MDQPPALRAQALVYDGLLRELYGIFLVDLLWTVLTLGVFRFWAVTRTRRYVWSHMRFQGERFEYAGTGGELLVGTLLAVLTLAGIVGVAGFLFIVLSAVSPLLAALMIMLLCGGVLAVAAGAVFSAQRYRLSRTLWAGTRGAMAGSALGYGARSLGYGLLVVLTLFQMAPWRAVRLAERRINASRLGNLRFGFHGRARAVYLPFLLTQLGTLLPLLVAGAALWALQGFYMGLVLVVFADLGKTLAAPQGRAALLMMTEVIGGPLLLLALIVSLIRLWYAALFERHVIGHSTLGLLRFSSTMTGRGLLWLSVGNGLIMLFTLGLGLPITVQRRMRFLASTLQVSGALDLTTQAGSLQGEP